MLRAMPSPKNTNFARLFIDRPCTGAAYDEKLPDAAAAALCEFLRDKLAPEDFAKFCELAGIDAGAAMDDEGGPEPFKGMPKPGGGKFGEDSLPRALQRARANAARIKVNF